MRSRVLGTLCFSAAVVTFVSLAAGAAVARAPAAMGRSQQAAAPDVAIPKIITKPTSPAGSNPGGNIPPSPSYPGVCQSQPTSTSCQSSAIAALNHARAVMSLPAYNLPAGFQSLAPASQLLVLSNLDRATYGLGKITGLNATLNQAAAWGIAADSDPRGPATVDGNGYSAWTANWAAGWASVLYTYYEWMYEDGYGSSNIDCASPGASGCWGHRAGTLANFGNTQVAMGVASGTSPRYHAPAFAEIYESFSPAARLSWQILAATLQPMPLGHVDTTTGLMSRRTLTGWALDPSSPNTSTRVQVDVGPSASATTANLSRPDVTQAFGLSSAAHGFSIQVSLPAGTSAVCAYAASANGAEFTTLGCWTFTVPTAPMGNIDAVTQARASAVRSP